MLKLCNLTHQYPIPDKRKKKNKSKNDESDDEKEKDHKKKYSYKSKKYNKRISFKKGKVSTHDDASEVSDGDSKFTP
jgi:hypothetical protein